MCFSVRLKYFRSACGKFGLIRCHWPPQPGHHVSPARAGRKSYLDSRYEMLGSQDSQDYDSTKDARTTPQKKKEFGNGWNSRASHSQHVLPFRVVQNIAKRSLLQKCPCLILCYHALSCFIIMCIHLSHIKMAQKNDHILVDP